MAKGNQVTLTFAGDATQLEKATATASNSADKMSNAVKSSSDKMNAGFDRSASAAVFLTDGIGNLSESVNALTAFANEGAARADRLARAHLEVSQAAGDMEQALGDARQAQLDLSQSQRDGAQSAIDVEQAQLDAEQAARDYAAAVAEFGEGSIEARQAQIDQKQAAEDLAQAELDAKQAIEDGNQAKIDSVQAGIDATSAQLDLNESQRAITAPTELSNWADKVSALSPLIFTAVGAVQLFTSANVISKGAMVAGAIATGVATAAQWAWNAAMTANPIGLIIAGIAALVAGIVWLVLNWDKVKAAGVAAWDWIKNAWSGAGAFFSRVWDALPIAAKIAFNSIARWWNSSIGAIGFTVPTWVPVVGGKSFSVPNIPTFHTGGVMPGAPGQEGLALLMAGETITPAGRSAGGGGTTVLEIRSSGSKVDDMMLEILRGAIRSRGGDVQVVLGR